MANIRNSNSFYIDSTGALNTDANTRVFYIVITSTAAPGTITIADNQGTPVTKLSLAVDVADRSTIFDFSRKPLIFPNGINITAITNCTAMIEYSTTGGQD